MVTTQQPHTPMTPAEAKAQAKAAKAYAKATRPLYKKKRVILPVALAAAIGIAVASQGGEDSPNGSLVTESSEAQAADGKAAKGGASDVGSADNPFKVGDTVELEGTQYTVAGATTQKTIGDEFLEETADGVFVVVDLTIENKKDETKTFLDTAATFVAQDGTKYEGSDDAIWLGDDSLFLRDMQPDLPTDGKLVFDVPEAKTAGGMVVVEDLFGRGEAHINLGLK